ncbi:MAG: 4Fe-4S binding protein [Planctomycetota bacterium]|jgi:ferredoxin
MRFHWFLPLPRKPDRAAGARKPGLLRRFLGRIGPTWASSPVRRLVQAAFFGLFFYLFLYVCWPYTARPAQSWHGWLPEEVDVETGRLTLIGEGAVPEAFAVGRLLYVTDASALEDPGLGRFRIDDVAGGKLALVPADALSPSELDKLSASFGPWSLSETMPGSWPSHYADGLEAKETLAAESFLAVDPLVSISTAVAARCWVWSLAAAGVVLLVCLVVPRGFCGYLCPLGTLIDLFDWGMGKRIGRSGATHGGWWVRLKYYLLAAVLAASLLGVLLSGFVAAIPVVTRGTAFLLSPLQMGFTRGWHQIPPLTVGHFVSVGLFLAVFGLGFMGPRFWCRYVCPTGVVFSLGNLFRATERKVESSCIACGACVKICPFDAVKPDFTTRTADCTFCQTCGGVCPTHSIKYVGRWDSTDLKADDDSSAEEPAAGRRRFLAAAAGVVAGTTGGLGLAAATRAFGARLDDPQTRPIVRPPGSVPEEEFLQLCIRCGECFQACPNNVLQPVGFEQGLEGLWAPRVAADWSGCEPSCANCGQVCPTGAIRALPLREKRGYDAVEFIRVGTEADPFGQPIEGSGFLAPVVVADKCVGCGLCQTRCHAINCKEKSLLRVSAVQVEAGEGREDRLTTGSYIDLRKREEHQRREQQRKQLEETGGDDGYLPDFLR